MNATEDRLRDLMMRSVAGDNAAYHTFLKELSSHLRGFFRKRMVQFPDEVEDLVQETLLAVHNYRHTYKLEQPLTAWIHAIARYKLVDMVRRRAGREALNDPLDDQREVFAVSDAEATDARRDIATLLGQLSENQRKAIQYVKLEGVSVSEAARMTGMSESAVKVSVHRGLKALAAKLKGKS